MAAGVTAYGILMVLMIKTLCNAHFTINCVGLDCNTEKFIWCFQFAACWSYDLGLYSQVMEGLGPDRVTDLYTVPVTQKSYMIEK